MAHFFDQLLVPLFVGKEIHLLVNLNEPKAINKLHKIHLKEKNTLLSSSKVTVKVDRVHINKKSNNTKIW
jgi:hypothetical protein